jgi:hypothetical protein
LLGGESFDVRAIAGSVAFAALAASLLLSHQPPQIETDRRAGKQSFAVRYGERRTRQWAIILLIVFLVSFGMALWARFGNTVTFQVYAGMSLLTLIYVSRRPPQPVTILIPSTLVLLATLLSSLFQGLGSSVQAGDTQRIVTILHLRKSRLFHMRQHFLLIGKATDRFDQVSISGGFTRNPGTQARYNKEGIEIVKRPNQRHRPGKLQAQASPPGFEYTVNFLQCGIHVGHVTDTECDSEGIDRIIGDWQAFAAAAKTANVLQPPAFTGTHHGQAWIQYDQGTIRSG